MEVLVTDASKRAALAAIRSAGSSGARVTAVSNERFAAGFLSRFVSKRVMAPDPRDEKRFVSALERIVSENDYDVLLPVHDFSLVPVLKKKRVFEKRVRVPFVDFKTFEKTCDKSATLKIAEKAGVPFPKTAAARSESEVEDAGRELSYPVVVKPVRQTISLGERFVTSYVTEKNYCRSVEELAARYAELSAVSPNVLVQEYAAGIGAGVGALFNRGEPRALFSYERIREYPVSGGPSTLRISTDDRVLKGYAKKILEELEWHGLAMVEFKKTPSGRPLLMEINGRFWGSIQLAISSGVDFPYLLCRMAVDGDVPPVVRYRVGVKQKWFMPGDLLHFASRFREGNKARVLADFVRSLKEDACEDYLVWDDPLPFTGALKTSFEYFIRYLQKTRSLSGEYR